jgi:uncharacterized repeat protein (TIGR01451 family)
MFIRRLSILALSAATFAFGAEAYALEATQKVEKEITVTQEDGSVTTQRLSVDAVTPGEKIVYTVSFVNNDATPASNLILAMPVPPTVRFLEGSADREGAVVRYSTDGGSSFAAREELTRPAVGGGTRPASADDITHIQWQIEGPVPVGAQDEILFKARLR